MEKTTEEEVVARGQELRDTLRRLADAAEAALSTEPDMPTYEATMDEFENVVDEARQLLKEEWP